MNFYVRKKNPETSITFEKNTKEKSVNFLHRNFSFAK